MKLNVITKPLIAAILVFALLLALTQGIAFQRYLILKDTEDRELSNHANWTKGRLQTIFTDCYATTRTLGFIVSEYGVPPDFDSTAKELLKLNPYIDAVQLVQSGVIKYIYPLKGNEAAIGLDILKDSLRRSGALKTIETRNFFVSGPFHLIQGGEGTIARLPVFVDDKFWGFSAVIIRLSTFLKAIEIDTSARRQYSYQLSQINSETGREEFFLKQDADFSRQSFIPVQCANGEWRLYIIAQRSNARMVAVIFSILGILLSLACGLLTWFIASQPAKLRELVEIKTQQILVGQNIFRTTLERLSVGFISLDRQFRVTFANKKIGEITRRDPGSLIGKNIWDVFPEAVGSETFKAFHQALSTQKNIINVDYFAPLDFWQENDIYPSPDGLTVFVKDITEATRAKALIVHERNLSESIINSLPGTFYMYNRDGKFTRWNKNFETISGYSAEEIRKMHPLDFFDTDEKELLRERIDRVFDDGIADVEAHFFTKQRQRIPYYFNGHKANLGGEDYLLGMGVNITERKEVENALIRSEAKFRYLFNNNPALIVIWDPQTFRILEVNDMVPQLYGYTRQEFLTMTIFDYRPKEDYEAVMAFARQLQSGDERKVKRVWRHVKKSGEVMYMDIASHRIDYGNSVAILSLAKDITDQVIAENQLKQTYEDIRRLNAHLQTIREEERSSIAREIHDELSQLLTGIKMDVSWLGKKLNSPDETLKAKIIEVQHLIDETVNTVRRISSDLRPGILDDLGLVAALEWQSGEFKKRSGITCQFETPLTELDINKDMATGLFRIYQESLTNIIRHAGASKVMASLEEENGFLILTIHDNGRGFDREEAEAKKTLGLIGMKERALMLGGELCIVSAKGNGTSVVVRVPINKG